MQAAAIQVPCFFLLCALVWKLGALAITKWAHGDAERTKVFAKGDEDRTLVIARGFADITAELKHHGERLGKIEERLDVADAIDDAVTGGHAIPTTVDEIPSRPITVLHPAKSGA